MATSRSEPPYAPLEGVDAPYAHLEGRRGRHAEQTRRRIRNKQRTLEHARLLRLGACPEWVERVLRIPEDA
jgi:hypothetical protein